MRTVPERDPFVCRNALAKHDTVVEVVDHQFAVQVKHGSVGNQQVALGAQTNQQHIAVVQRRDGGIRGKPDVLAGQSEDIGIAARIQVDGILHLDFGGPIRRAVTLDRHSRGFDRTVDRNCARALRDNAEVAETSSAVADLVIAISSQGHRSIAGVDGKVCICTGGGHIAADRHPRSGVVIVVLGVKRVRHAV